MKYAILNLGTLSVNAFEMIMGVTPELIRDQYRIDEKGQMRIGMNGLIVETGNRLVMMDPGCATFLSKSLADTYDPEMDQSLEEAVRGAGYSPDDFTDVLFTHLHFDHGSGAFSRIQGGIVKVFPNARYVVSRKQLEYIQSLPSSESSSFFHKLLRFAGTLSYAEDWEAENIEFFISHAHTPHMLVPLIRSDDHDLLYATDLMPMKIFMEKGSYSYYDVEPSLADQERDRVLQVVKPGTEVVYYHEERRKANRGVKRRAR